jgi:hypothetical protein
VILDKTYALPQFHIELVNGSPSPGLSTKREEKYQQGLQHTKAAPPNWELAFLAFKEAAIEQHLKA